MSNYPYIRHDPINQLVVSNLLRGNYERKQKQIKIKNKKINICSTNQTWLNFKPVNSKQTLRNDTVR